MADPPPTSNLTAQDLIVAGFIGKQVPGVPAGYSTVGSYFAARAAGRSMDTPPVAKRPRTRKGKVKGNPTQELD